MPLRRALLAVALLGALVVHLMWDVALGIALLIFFVGWPIVGTLVTIDDDLPGGWSNPDGSALWVRRAQADRTHSRAGLTTAEREDLARLREENRELRTERDIPKKPAFFAKHQA